MRNKEKKRRKLNEDSGVVMKMVDSHTIDSSERRKARERKRKRERERHLLSLSFTLL